MNFPSWVDDPSKPEQERASARLRYMMTRVAIDHVGRGTIRAFSNLVGIDHSTLAYSIRRGFCTPSVAIQIEEKLGRDVLPNEYLRRPLEIEGGV